MAKVTLHPGGSGADSIVIGSARPDLNGFDVHSKDFRLDTPHEELWANAYAHLIERARTLVAGDTTKVSVLCAVDQNEVVCAHPGCTGPYNCKERGLQE